MKKTKITALALSLILCFGCFIGCSKTPQTGVYDPTTDGYEKPIESTELTLAADGKTAYKAVIPADATEAVAFAASELKDFFLEATGATLPVETDTGKTFSESDAVISIGNTSILTGSGVTANVSELTTDGYKIERKGNTVVIVGGDDSGTAYGVYEFLSRQFGLEFYASDEIKIEKSATTYLKDFHLTDIPAFEGRAVDGLTDFDPLLAHRMRIRLFNHSDARFDYSASCDWVGGHCHTFYTIMPPSKYNRPLTKAEQDAKKAAEDAHETWVDPRLSEPNYHPEWYRVSNGLCLTNTALINEFVANCIELLKANPSGAYMNISEEDGMGLCSCASCQAERAQYKTSGWMVRFCNTVINRIETWVTENQPGRQLKYLTFAYSSGTVTPPVTPDETNGGYKAIDASVVPHDKLYIRFAPINYCYSHALTDTRCAINTTCAQDIAGWRAITDRFMIWDYEVNYNNYFMFFNHYDSIATNLLTYKDMGVINIIRQSNTGARVSSMDALKLYLNSKLMWEPARNVEGLISDFMQNYYKDGAPYMREYFNMTRAYLKRVDASREGGLHFQLYDNYQPDLPTAQVWSKRILEQSLELFDKAYAAYDALTDRELAEKLKLRVCKESLCVRYLVLKNWGSYYNINSPAFEQTKAQFAADVDRLQAFYVKEGGATSSWLDSLTA